MIKSPRIVYVLLLPLLIFIAKIYYDRAGGFSFGDEWNNFIAGYFMGKGKTLYEDIFFNHQMLPAYISYVIQKVTHPKSLYQLVLYHRLFIVAFSGVMSLLLVYRFRFIGLLFVLFYESTKFYLFGHLFLAESMVVYVVVYMASLAWEKIYKKKAILWHEVSLSGVGTWFVIFSREPFIPLVLFLYFIIMKGSLNKEKYISAGLCVGLSILSFIPIHGALREFFYQNIIFNFTYILPYESSITGSWWRGILNGLFYPVGIFFGDKWNHFRILLIGLNVIFLIALFYTTILLKKIKLGLFIFFTLGLAGIRTVAPGTLYYEAFHILVWYGLFIMLILLLIRDLNAQKKQKAFYILSILLCVVGIYIFSARSFVWEKIDKNALITQNYVHYYLYGEGIQVLSKPEDKLFADMWDYLIYFQTGLDTDYRYSIYSFATTAEKKYRDARLDMFRLKPPDFYYTLCPKEKYRSELLPADQINSYTQLYLNGKPTCTYVHKNKIPEITQKQWESAKKLGFYLPE